MREVKLVPGDVILVPKENTAGIYTFIAERFGKAFADALSFFFGHNYIHAEIYVANGWQMGAWFDGVKVWKPPLNYFGLVHVYRLKPELKKVITIENMLEAVRKYFNREYDFPSLILNALIQILSFNSEKREAKLQADFGLYANERVICSELVAKIYEDIGITIEHNSEFVTPDDIANSSLFYRVL